MSSAVRTSGSNGIGCLPRLFLAQIYGTLLGVSGGIPNATRDPYGLQERSSLLALSGESRESVSVVSTPLDMTKGECGFDCDVVGWGRRHYDGTARINSLIPCHVERETRASSRLGVETSRGCRL